MESVRSYLQPSALSDPLGSGIIVASGAAPIAAGRSEPVPGRDFQSAVDQRLFTAHRRKVYPSGEYRS